MTEDQLEQEALGWLAGLSRLGALLLSQQAQITTQSGFLDRPSQVFAALKALV